MPLAVPLVPLQIKFDLEILELWDLTILSTFVIIRDTRWSLDAVISMNTDEPSRSLLLLLGNAFLLYYINLGLVARHRDSEIDSTLAHLKACHLTYVGMVIYHPEPDHR
jgi:hypothetical protein